MTINSESEAIHAGFQNNFWLHILKQCASNVEAIATAGSRYHTLFNSDIESIRGKTSAQLIQYLKSYINLPRGSCLG